MEKNPCFILQLPRLKIRAIMTHQITSGLRKNKNINTDSHDIRLHNLNDVIEYEFNQALKLICPKDLLLMEIQIDFIDSSDEKLPTFDAITAFFKLPHTIPILIFPEEIVISEHKAWVDDFIQILRFECSEVVYLPTDKDKAVEIIAKRYQN